MLPHRRTGVSLALIMLARALCTPASAVEFAGGTGEPNDPYQIATAADLIAIGSDPNLLDKHFVLTADIDLDPNLPGGRVFGGAVIAPDTGDSWDYEGTPFTGVFDGRGHVIRNPVIDALSGRWIGLFGWLGEGAQVRNLGIAGGLIRGSQYVGALAGECRNGRVFAVYSETPVTGYQFVGGLIGSLSEGQVRCCYASGDVQGTSYVGGLVGLNGGSIVISYATGAVPCENKSDGGLDGGLNTGGGSFLSYWDVDTSGQVQSASGQGKSAELMHRADTYRGWGHDCVWTIDDGKDYPRLLWQDRPGALLTDPPRTHGGGTGEPNDPYQIHNATQLVTIGWYETDLNKSFVLAADIDFNDAPTELLMPIGSLAVPFTGVFDGGGHVIDNVHYARDQEDFTGLFGAIGGRLRNLRLTNVRVHGRNSVGGLVATNGGVIEQVQVSGSIGGGYNIGGLAGQNMAGGAIISCRSDVIVTATNTAGAITGYNGGRIVDCHSIGVVTGQGGVGGLVASNYGEITRCSSAGKVSSQGGAGGLAYQNARTISACFSTCTVTGIQQVGGLVGSSWGLVLSCYATGRTVGDSDVGGLVGLSYYGIAACCYSTGAIQGKTGVGGLTGGSMSTAHLSYWDVQTSGMTTSAAGAARTTSELMKADTFRGWGCEGAWVIDDGHDYPRLAWEGRPGQAIADEPRPYEGTGTIEDPYQIRTPEEFVAIQWFYTDFNKHFVLLHDLDLGTIDARLLAPIGKPKLPFTGTFDGRGHTITNWTFDRQENYIGVFGCVQPVDPNQRSTSGVVKNLHLEGLKVTGLYYVGGLTGTNHGSIVSCTVGGEVAGNRYVGGLIGENNGYVEGCRSGVQVAGDMGVGGLTGRSTGDILSCTAQGIVEGDTAVGGLAGYNSGFDSDGLIRSCHTDMEVSGNQSTGGLVGDASRGLVTSCSSAGSVKGRDATGGLIGYQREPIVTQCSSTAQVIGSGYQAGGLVGWNEGGSIGECFASGRVEGRAGVGGLVGLNHEDNWPAGWFERTSVRFCYARGDVRGTEQVGGLVGRNMQGTLYGCYSTGRVTGTKSAGGLLGDAGEYGPVRLCYWDVQTSGVESSAGGGLGRTTVQLMTADTFIGWGNGVWRIDQGHDYPRLAWEQTPGELIGETSPRYGGGAGTPEDPYQIRTAAQLMNLAYCPDDYDKHFVLMADLDFASVDPNRVAPIGMDLIPFVGIFEGNGHTISNFTYARASESDVGLFGCLGSIYKEWTASEGVIRNVHMIDIRLEGKNNVGALVGYSSGTILGCSASGAIRGVDTVGGLVGANSGIVEQCWAHAIVSGTTRTGGLVGYHIQNFDYRPGWMHACRTGGEVRGDSCTGGLAGSSYGVIESCYSQARVAGRDRAGGLLGVNERQGVVARCYATGLVTGTGIVGGLIGFSLSDLGSRPLTVMSYWDVEASGVVSSAGGYGRSTSQMFLADTYEWWGSYGDWTIREGADYPRLTWENAGGATITGAPYAYGGGSGRLEDPFQIWTARQFAAIAEHYEDFDKCFILMADIDCNDVPRGLLQPIGTYGLPFTGVLDGNGHTIANFRYETKNEATIGLIGYLGSPRSKGGTVRDLRLIDMVVTGADTVGGLVGYACGGSIIACDVSGQVTGSRQVGGLIGYAFETNVDFCCVSGYVHGYADIGGVTGYHGGGRVTRTRAVCNVSGHEKLGGLFGSWTSGPESLLSQCVTAGTVRGHHQLGGLAGYSSGPISDCYATAEVIGEEYIANRGIIGPVTVASSAVGGLLGTNAGHIMYSYCASHVQGHQGVGGLVGQFGGEWKPEATHCFWDAELSGTADGIGMVHTSSIPGKPTAQMQTAATFIDAGWDFENTWMICEGKDYPRLRWEEVERGK